MEANGVEVAAVGTEFNVNSRKEKVVESVLVKGRVEVENGTRQVMLTPNQLVVCDVETSGIVVKRLMSESTSIGKTGILFLVTTAWRT